MMIHKASSFILSLDQMSPTLPFPHFHLIVFLISPLSPVLPYSNLSLTYALLFTVWSLGFKTIGCHEPPPEWFLTFHICLPSTVIRPFDL